MSKKKRNAKETPQDIAMTKWNVENNGKFMEFVEKNREEVFERLKKAEEDNGSETYNMLDAGIITLLRYTKSDGDFAMIFNLFVCILAEKYDENEDRQTCINELWRMMFTLNVATEMFEMDKDKGCCHLAEGNIAYYLYRYLWEDYEQYVKDNNLELY